MDKTTKLLLAAIALGLWANAGIPKAHSADYDYIDIAYLQARMTTLEDKISAIERKVCGLGCW